MKSSRLDVLILVLIAVVAGVLLSGTFTNTEADIKAAQERLRQEALKKVMPFMHDAYETKTHSFNGLTVPLYTVTSDGVFQGAALELTAKEGYGGDIVFLLGLDPDAKVTGIYILKHAETPGLGAKAADQKWWGQFLGKFKPDTHFKVKKDGGDIDAITASTITSRAITNQVDIGLDLYQDFLTGFGKTNLEGR